MGGLLASAAMAVRSTPVRQRVNALLAGAVALVTLGTVLLIWLSSTATASRAPFGSSGSIAMIVAGLVVVASGAVLVYAAPRLPTAARWSAALVLALVNGGIGCLALITVLTPEDQSDIGIGLLLGIAVIATNAIAGQVARRPPTT